MSNQYCSTCRFYSSLSNTRGQCKRKAPYLDSFTGALDGLKHNNSIWPEVSDSDWCGDFQENNETLDKEIYFLGLTIRANKFWNRIWQLKTKAFRKIHKLS